MLALFGYTVPMIQVPGVENPVPDVEKPAPDDQPEAKLQDEEYDPEFPRSLEPVPSASPVALPVFAFPIPDPVKTREL